MSARWQNRKSPLIPSSATIVSQPSMDKTASVGALGSSHRPGAALPAQDLVGDMLPIRASRPADLGPSCGPSHSPVGGFHHCQTRSGASPACGPSCSPVGGFQHCLTCSGASPASWCSFKCTDDARLHRSRKIRQIWTLTKGTNKFPGTHPREMKTYKLPNKEFKIIIL